MEGKSKKFKGEEKLRGDFKRQVETIPTLDKNDLKKDKEDNDDDFFWQEM